MRRHGPRCAVRPVFWAKDNCPLGNRHPPEHGRRQRARVDPAGVRDHRARPRLGRARRCGGKELFHAPLHFGRIARIEPARHGRRPHLRPLRLQPALDRVALEHQQLRVVVLPGVGRQAGLDADLLQKGQGIQVMVHGHSGQQQSAGAAAGNLHPVLADGDRLHAILAAGRHRLRPPQDPHVHVELAQFTRRDGRETRIVGRRSIGRTVQRGPERHRQLDVSAARAELARPPESDERPVDRRVGRLAQQDAGRFGRLAPDGRRHPAACGTEDRGLLFFAEGRTRCKTGGFRRLGR